MIRNYENPQAEELYRKITEHPEEFPLCFTYDGTDYKGLKADNIVPVERKTEAASDRETNTAVFHLGEQLEIRFAAAFYKSYGAMEWTVWFTNRSDRDSAVLEKVRSQLEFVGDAPVLSGIYGDHEKFYEPYEKDLTKENVCFRAETGRATHVEFPYFNLEYGTGGAMLAIGWAGTWQAEFERTERGVRYTAQSVNDLCTYLKPGESIRTALFVVAPYTVRDRYYAANYWRSWYLACNLPKANAAGEAVQPFSTYCCAWDTGLPNSDGSISERYDTWRPTLEKMLAEEIHVDFRWVDAGWYIAPDGGSAEPYVEGHDWWDTVGTWELDPVKWPDGTFRESTDFARAHGMKTLVWFEPERVTSPDLLAQNFGYCREWAIEREGVGEIANNIGIEACRKDTTERICKMLRENRVEMYREDNNLDSARLWKYLDSREGEGRTGITECKVIDGHYKMWDDIIDCTLSHGGCGFVDSCASGGGRNDLESMRRGIPLLRSDADRTSTALRLSMTTAFNAWIPFCGALTQEKEGQLEGTGESDQYIWRASYLPVLNVGSLFAQEPDQDFSALRDGIAEWKKTAPYLLKEFYVLTPWHMRKDKTSFTAFSYFDAEAEKGLILAFRQEECKEDTLRIDLPYAEEGCTCVIADEDTGEVCRIAFEELKRDGLTLQFEQPRTAKLLWVTLER